MIRLPSSPDRVPEVRNGGSGLRCPATGTEFPYHEGILDLLPNDGPKTLSQRSLDTAFTAWLYDRTRESILRLDGLPDFKTEVGNILSRLQAQPEDPWHQHPRLRELLRVKLGLHFAPLL